MLETVRLREVAIKVTSVLLFFQRYIKTKADEIASSTKKTIRAGGKKI